MIILENYAVFLFHFLFNEAQSFLFNVVLRSMQADVNHISIIKSISNLNDCLIKNSPDTNYSLLKPWCGKILL